MGVNVNPVVVPHDAAGNALLGQQTMARSVPVTMATDQPAIPVTLTAANARTGVVSSILALGGGTAGTLQPMRSTTYNEQAANAQRSFASSSASDTAAGVGARKVNFTYYTTTGTGPFTETVTLNGVTAVATVATNIRFIEIMEVTEVGSSGANVGTITMFVNNTGGGGTVGTIGVGTILAAVGDNQTLWAHHYVETGLIVSLSTLVVGAQSGGANTSARFLMRQQAVLTANAAEQLVADVLLVQGAFARLFNFYVQVPGFTRLTCYCIPSVNNTTVTAAFDYSEV
jgi:hypothetical protein